MGWGCPGEPSSEGEESGSLVQAPHVTDEKTRPWERAQGCLLSPAGPSPRWPEVCCGPWVPGWRAEIAVLSFTLSLNLLARSPLRTHFGSYRGNQWRCCTRSGETWPVLGALRCPGGCPGVCLQAQAPLPAHLPAVWTQGRRGAGSEALQRTPLLPWRCIQTVQRNNLT